jgi:asparagine synthetase B (glutamine-hydrolysing)
MIAELLMNEINVPDDDCAVLLSGGVDSISVGFAAERLGKKVHAYSFCLDTHPSYDFQKAKEIAEIFNWPFTGIEVPTKNLADDWHRLVQLDCRKKTHFECVYPFLYVYPEIKQKYVLSGWAADGYYGVSKKAQIHYKHTQELFDKFRDNYFSPEMCAGYNWHKKVSDEYDKVFVTPYLTESVKEFFYSKSWDEVNKPFQKHHVRNAFDEFKRTGKIKNHLNLQIDSGIVELFESLLPNKEINFKNRSRIMDVCRDWNVLNTTKTNSNTLEEFLI